MSNKELTYTNVFELDKGISFNLYPYDDIDYEQSKDSIKAAFEHEHEEQLKTVLASIGLEYVRLEYYSPRAYNFEGDNLDLVIKVIDKQKFKEYVLKYEEEIDQALRANRSYDGFMSLTTPSVYNELDDIEQEHYEPDVLVLKVILNKLMSFKDFNPYEHFVYEEEKEEVEA